EIQGAVLSELGAPTPNGLGANWRFDDADGAVFASDSVGARAARLAGGARLVTEVPPSPKGGAPTATSTASVTPPTSFTPTSMATSTPSVTPTATATVTQT